MVAALFVALLCFGKVPPVPARKMCEALALPEAWATVTGTAFTGAKTGVTLIQATNQGKPIRTTRFVRPKVLNLKTLKP